ncbi:MAG: hypothetical protein AMJ46_03520 [Latescibacteria bacterium DG_63]|nr:MAG: hypothetical protein AMJ46_03520 [Latescibacteria bacterium DG_63]
MNPRHVSILVAALVLLAVAATPNRLNAKELVRPEEIKSLRVVIYDRETYEKLARLWKDYFDEYPSEYAYANWMYAARYAKLKDYSELLAKGMKKYPANPTLLYLKGIEHPGAHGDVEGRKYLERAVALDPGFTNAWFALVIHYMDSGDEERLDMALRRLLESRVISDEVMDYSYNMLLTLEDNAILVTNGDNDTYPGWILTRILNVRPDVDIVNRSLLNSDWYPMYVIEHGLSRFTDRDELEDLRSSILKEMKKKKASADAGGPFGDTLIVKIVESAERARRPVYISRTVFITKKLKPLLERGRDLGLVTLATRSEIPYAEQLRKVYGKWIKDFRTGGLQSWRLRSAPDTDAGRSLMSNYAAGAVINLESLKKNAPELRVKLFQWYIQHAHDLLSEDLRHNMAQGWCCYASDLKEVDTWCRKQGVECKKE